MNPYYETVAIEAFDEYTALRGLQNRVQELHDQGYVCQGGIAPQKSENGRIILYQAMVLKEEESIEKED